MSSHPRHHTKIFFLLLFAPILEICYSPFTVALFRSYQSPSLPLKKKQRRPLTVLSEPTMYKEKKFLGKTDSSCFLAYKNSTLEIIGLCAWSSSTIVLILHPLRVSFIKPWLLQQTYFYFLEISLNIHETTVVVFK